METNTPEFLAIFLYLLSLGYFKCFAFGILDPLPEGFYYSRDPLSLSRKRFIQKYTALHLETAEDHFVPSIKSTLGEQPIGNFAMFARIFLCDCVRVHVCAQTYDSTKRRMIPT